MSAKKCKNFSLFPAAYEYRKLAFLPPIHTPAAGQYAVHRVFKQTPAEVWFFKPHLCRHFLTSSLRTGAAFLRICQRLSSISITKAVESIRAGDLSRRITGIATKDEVQELADTFNTMLERLERSFERERQFTSDASHELRTPVAVISACAEELEAGLSAGEAAQSLAAIRRESARMNKIISQLLMLTRGYEGRIHLEKETLEFRNLVGSVMEELSESAAASEIRLLNQVPQGCTIFADQSLLTQLLINLIGNSIKYGVMGGKVTVRAAASETGCTFTVSDNGIGMQPEELDHIFERFYRADKARDRSGFGLGMPIVKWIVELHGGDIRVASEAGKGTQVTVTV